LRTEPRLALGVSVAALFIGANWVVYVAAVLADHTTEAALGYFLNPIVTVALGVFVLGERLRRLQWVAVGIGAVAGLYLSVAAGSVPLIALALAFSFGMYGLVKKKVGVSLQAMHSLAAETMVLGPVAAVLLVVLTSRGDTTFTGHGAWHTSLLVLAGVATAVPLLLFAAAARRVPLVTIGLLQFITPILQLLCGVLLLHEHMSAQRWLGFGIVWVALAVLTVDSLRARPRRRRTRLPARAMS
jgi:chloramphenicol-sensitive protein RarD